MIGRAYDLVLWSCQHTARFPRSHRFVLGERIERNLYALLEGLIQARYTRERRALLVQANLTLEVLRFQIRLAKDLECLRVNSYAFAARRWTRSGVWWAAGSRAGPMPPHRRERLQEIEAGPQLSSTPAALCGR